MKRLRLKSNQILRMWKGIFRENHNFVFCFALLVSFDFATSLWYFLEAVRTSTEPGRVMVFAANQRIQRSNILRNK